MDIRKNCQNRRVSGITCHYESCISLCKQQEISSLISKLKLLLDKLAVFESCPLSAEDALIICLELFDLSKSDQWLQYKSTILNNLIEIRIRERKYLQENNDLQINCLNLYKNCQNLEECLQNASRMANNIEKQQELKPYSMYERKHLTELLRGQKSSLIHNMEALAKDKEKFLIDLSSKGIHDCNLSEVNLINSTADLQSELKMYEQLVELKEEAFGKLKENFYLNMEKMNVDVDDIHAISIKYHELVKQEASEIVQLKNKVYQLQEQMEQPTKVTSIDDARDYSTGIKHSLQRDITNQQNIYDLMKHLKICVAEILEISKSFSGAGISNEFKSIENIHIQEKCTTNNDKPFTSDKSIQTEDYFMMKATEVVHQLKEETDSFHRNKKHLFTDFGHDFQSERPDIQLRRNSEIITTYGNKEKMQENWNEMLHSLATASIIEEDLRQELELKTLELDNLNQVFNEQNEHLRKLEKYSMTLELKRQEDIESLKKSFQTEMKTMREELDFCRSEMNQQAQLIFVLQKTQNVHKSVSKEKVKMVKYQQSLDNRENRKENCEHLEMSQHIESGGTTDDNLTILNKLLKTEYNHKVDYSSRKLPKISHSVSQTNKGHSKVLGEYSEERKEILNSKIKFKNECNNRRFEMDTHNETPNLIDDYKKFMQKFAETEKRFPKLTSSQSC